MSKKRDKPVGMGGYQGTGGAFDWGNVVKWLTSTNGPGGYGTRAGGNLPPWDWSPGINLPASVISWTPFGVGSPGWRPENTQTPVPQTSAAPGKLPPWTWTPTPAWISSLYPGSATMQTPVAQAAQTPQVNAPQAQTALPQTPASGDRPWLENMFLYNKDGKLSGMNPLYGASWVNASRYKETGDPGALNSYGQPFGTLAPYGQNLNSRARGGQPRKRTPELEAKLQWAHKLLNDLRKNKNNRQPQSQPGQTAANWYSGMGSMNI